MKLCNTCDGQRFVIKQVPRTWSQDGVSCVMGNLTTGISHVCDDCQGAGLAIDPERNPDCSWCHGTGERNAWDMDEYTVEQCDCENPSLRSQRSEQPANPIERLYLSALEVS